MAGPVQLYSVEQDKIPRLTPHSSMITSILIPFLRHLFCKPREFTFSSFYPELGTFFVIKKTEISILFTCLQNVDFIKTPNCCKTYDKTNSTAKHIHFLKATSRTRRCLELQKVAMGEVYLLVCLCQQNSYRIADVCKIYRHLLISHYSKSSTTEMS